MSLRGAATLLAALALATPVGAQPAAPSPGEIVAAAPQSDWVAIAPEDLLVMTLSPNGEGQRRQVLIQLMPPPLSRGWVDNIRTLARAHWYDGLAVMRVQDNYVVQWGDPNHDNPESEGPEKPLPQGVRTVAEEYVYPRHLDRPRALDPLFVPPNDIIRWTSFYRGFPVAGVATPDTERNWPVHCYGMVGVGHGMPPDTGTGGELYAVIGQAPRHLDRNLALVGRVVEGIEYLSSLPRGKGDAGFYVDPAQRTRIESIRVASDLPTGNRPRFEYLSTDSDSFAAYAAARANRRDAFFVSPAEGADICNIPVPVRRAKR